MNAIDRSVDLIVPDGEPAAKLERIDQTETNGAVRLVIRNEGHTLGNLLTARLMRQGHVSFAGYRVPHPLEPVVHVKFKKALKHEGDKKGPTTPKEIVLCATHDLIRELAEIESDFQDTLKDFSIPLKPLGSSSSVSNVSKSSGGRNGFKC